jgi:hypothetical protein
MTTKRGLDENRLDAVQSFSDGDGQWRTEPSLNCIRSAPACAVYRGGLYCIGGRQSDTVNSSVDRFDGRAWTAVTPMAVPRWATSASTYNGKLYVFGGLPELENRGGGSGKVECFNGAWWMDAPRLKEARSSVACTV